MPTEATDLLFAIGLATVIVVAGATPLLGGPYQLVRRMLLPFLWIGSREWRTPFGQFASRDTFTRQTWVVAWFFTLMLVLVIVVTL